MMMEKRFLKGLNTKANLLTAWALTAPTHGLLLIKITDLPLPLSDG